MDAAAFQERVTGEMATELDRLGSEKLLIALTDAELTTPAVLAAAAASEAAAHRTFAGWADTEPTGASETFAALAQQEAEHYARVVAAFPDGAEAPPTDLADTEIGDGGPLHAHLRAQAGTVERAAGLVGRGLVGDRTHLQVIGYFVNEGDEERAELFRGLRAETEAATEDGLALLSTHCESEADWTGAVGVATYAIQVAYDDYADALTGLGLDPRPIC